MALGVKFRVKLYIVNCYLLNYLSKLPILSKANSILTTDTGSSTMKESENEYQQVNIDEMANSQSEEPRLPITVYRPCDSQSREALMTSSIFMLSKLKLYCFFQCICFFKEIFLVLLF